MPLIKKATWVNSGVGRSYTADGLQFQWTAKAGNPQILDGTCPGLSSKLPIALWPVSAGIADLSGLGYPVAMGAMKGITIKLPEATVLQLKRQARQSGCSVAALVRELVDAPTQGDGSVYAITADLAGSLAGGSQPATNARRRFRRE